MGVLSSVVLICKSDLYEKFVEKVHQNIDKYEYVSELINETDGLKTKNDETAVIWYDIKWYDHIEGHPARQIVDMLTELDSIDRKNFLITEVCPEYYSSDDPFTTTGEYEPKYFNADVTISVNIEIGENDSTTEAK